MEAKVLTQMVDQFHQRHKSLPSKIVIDPLALVALGLKKSVSSFWNGVPVECREISPEEPKGAPNALGVHLYIDPEHPELGSLESFDVWIQKP